MTSASATNEPIRVFQTLEHACGYYADRTARNLVLDPVSPALPQLYGRALERGFRRSGGHVYRPNCPSCRACISARIAVERFVPDRSQRRCERRNADLELRVQPAIATDENFALYRRYLAARHAGGGMDDPEPDDFDRFLACEWSPTRFLELRRDGELLAVAVTDVLPVGLSAVYTFYAPEHAPRGLGTCAILRQIALAQSNRLPHVYLGYWIAGHPKMDYKARFHALERLRDGVWRTQ
ncbi:arginyltransferase [Chiayiivirga flava]|uniref:Aspartate/glutamate leucyltransferase n=1 Tax=Chiayiivirga flava TaxID=659595 RepID=A0A7W8FZK8_9GAMM|nr:arginyltransferase [Chiayiivirga flava]MBB5208221.1 arginine-tRNA-protein transferase [Chiayiivirga flava]